MIRWLCVVAAATALAAGCGGSASGGTRASGAASQHAAAPLDPNFAMGQTVLITERRVRPLWLISLVGKPIVFENTTGSTVRVTFDHISVRSGPIPPGGVFRYTPRLALSLTYHVGSRPGKVQVSPVEGASS